MQIITTEDALRIADALLAAIAAGEEGASERLPGVPEFVLDKGYLVGVPSTEVPDLNVGWEGTASVLGSWIMATIQTLTSQGLGIDGLATAGVWTDDDGKVVFNLSTWHAVEGDALKACQNRGETAIWDVKNETEIRP